MFSARCRGHDDKKVFGKFGDCFKTESVEECVRDTDIYQGFHPRMLTYFIRCIALLPSLILTG